MYKQDKKQNEKRSKVASLVLSRKSNIVQGVNLVDNRNKPLQLGRLGDLGGKKLSQVRKSFVTKSISSIGTTKDPRYITALIIDSLTGYTKVYKALQGNDYEDMDDPKTEEKHNTLSHAKSRDAEMYIIDWLHSQLGQIIQLHRKRSESSFNKNGLIKIELVGPRGTCTDCQAALQRQLGALNRLVHINLGRNYSVKLNTRYIGYKVESTKTARKYGSSGSKDKESHWKWKAAATGYTGPGPEPKKWMYDEDYRTKQDVKEPAEVEPTEVDFKKE